ncbi:DUF2252 domain-containing protein [Massilia sp. S19_KUP03_FR1]|uniref:DUF2252 domain-containing protein n=1 Tax=Massilia sp. S19_KUP03_FR1 TaxID=3025503 RepID=UPI002FCDBC45
MNIIKRIQKANAGRDPELLERKYRALRSAPFTFMRGTNGLFYDRLAASGYDVAAPAVWCCGDLHLQNFGSYRGDNGLVYFDLNDFDGAALAPASWELVRLAASLRVGLTELGQSEQRVATLVEALIATYAATLADGKAGWIERDSAQGVVQQLLAQLRDRKRPAFLDSRTVEAKKQRRLLVDGSKALPVPEAERALVAATIDGFAASIGQPDFFRVLDVARRIAGTGSLGLPRYVVLVEGNGSPDGNYLIDLKRAPPSPLGALFAALQPVWGSDAERIAGVQHHMQAVTAAWLHPLTHLGQPFVLRALQPSEDQLPFDEFGKQHDLFDGAIDMLGRCTAWAQLRSGGWRGAATADALIAFASKTKWQRQVAQAAAGMAAQVMDDWATYAAAYDAGQFRAV